MISNFKSIGGQLTRGITDPSTAEIKGILSSRNDWLLIFDNMDEEPTLSNIKVDLLPPREFGQVLIAGRFSSLRSVGYAVEVPLLDSQESRDLLRRCCPWFRLHEDDGGALTSLLGQLPLAMKQAGLYMEVNSIPVSEFLRR